MKKDRVSMNVQRISVKYSTPLRRGYELPRQHDALFPGNAICVRLSGTCINPGCNLGNRLIRKCVRRVNALDRRLAVMLLKPAIEADVLFNILWIPRTSPDGTHLQPLGQGAVRTDQRQVMHVREIS